MPHTLPPLDYAYDALEPHIDEATMRLHHDKHHQGYVDGLNKAEEALAKARESGDVSGVRGALDAAAFNGSGHLLHTIFWKNMGPKKGGEPGGDLGKAIAKDFGSFDAFKKEFTASAMTIQGSGWAILAYRALDGRLIVLQSEKHQNCTQWGVQPLLVLDMWEHAFYLKHQNKKGDYVTAFWNVINWDDVGERLKAAR